MNDQLPSVPSPDSRPPAGRSSLVASELVPAEPVDRLEVVDTPAIPTMAVRDPARRMDRLPALMDGVFSQLPRALADAGIEIVGPAVALYRARPTDTVDLEVGFPVRHAAAGEIELSSGFVAVGSELPAGRVARVSHRGGYDQLASAWEAMSAELSRRGEATTTPFWEVYVTFPEPGMDPGRLRTDLVTSLR